MPQELSYLSFMKKKYRIEMHAKDRFYMLKEFQRAL